jgi:glutathione S-transferase
MTNILYSFRRCPYAIRARLAIAYSQSQVQLREVALKNKPPELLTLSVKGTVPVLLLADKSLLDESLDIMIWALENNDPEEWLKPNLTTMLALIDENDFEFKTWLDKYKYASNDDPALIAYYRQEAENFLFKLEQLLLNTPYLFGEKVSLADIAIFPFIRQFEAVDLVSFEKSKFSNIKKWLNHFSNSELFLSVMDKYPTWLESGQAHPFPKING